MIVDPHPRMLKITDHASPVTAVDAAQTAMEMNAAKIIALLLRNAGRSKLKFYSEFFFALYLKMKMKQ